MDIDIEEYYRRYAPMVLRRCRYLLGDEDRALDAMQDVFVRLMTGVKSLKGTYPSGLLYRMVSRGSNDLYTVDMATGREQLLTPHDGPVEYEGVIAPEAHAQSVTAKNSHCSASARARGSAGSNRPVFSAR